MNSLIHPFAEITEQDKYMPGGFSHPEEARLGETPGFLDGDEARDREKREALTGWFLAVSEKANTPNWDIAATCKVGGRAGLLLLEAKAHAGELNTSDSYRAKNEQNRQRIPAALQEASRALGNEWSLTVDRCYQLNNRFAWAWKIATLHTPVVLVYLGFLRASEMPGPFETGADWKRSLLRYAEGCVPEKAWNSERMVDGTPLIPLIRSAEVNVIATSGQH